MRRPRKPKEEEVPVDRLLELIDEQVKRRLELELAQRETTAEITRLASEARRKGATMPALVAHVKRVGREGDVDKKTGESMDGKLISVTRQWLDGMLAMHEGRRAPKTTRASRRRREPEEAETAAAGTLNLSVLL